MSETKSRGKIVGGSENFVSIAKISHSENFAIHIANFFFFRKIK